MIAPAKTRTTPEQARHELKRRRKAKRDFLAFCEYVDPRFETPPHIRLLGYYLQEVARYIETGGKKGIGRLMITMPPRHGKTESASRKFPAFVLGRIPDARVILTSYGADLAVENNRKVKELVESNRYQALFGIKSAKSAPVELSSDSRSGQAWDLAQPHRGGSVAAGVGGAITGRGAHLLVVDDPFKNREEAESETRRDLVDDWYKSSAYTRLEPGGAVIVFHTRWHSDDLAGRLIARMATDPLADNWTIVSLPALALEEYPETPEKQAKEMRDGIFRPLEDPLKRRPGQALWRERFDEDALGGIKVNVGLYDFEALYQQSPYSREGNFFKRDWFTVVPQGPAEIYARVRAWDKAATAGGGARTSGTKMSWGRDDYVYIEHVFKEQLSSADRDQQMVEIGEEDYKADGPFLIWHPQDPGSAGVDSAQATNAMLAAKGLIGTFDPISGSKEVNAGPLASMAKAGRVRLVSGAWNDDFLDEAAAFPKGKFKDQVDSAASGYNQLRQIVEVMKAEEEEVVVYDERVQISPV